ncbi:MAG: esterase-like activity of phytase family protein [Microcoleaceae cyanobacterium]
MTTAPSKTAPVQFYDLNLELDSNFSLTPAANSPRIKQAKIQNVTPLQNKQGETLPSETTQPESLVFSPRNSIFITTEEQEGDLAFPFIGEFDLGSGQLRNIVPIPPRYYPEIEQGTLVQGVQPESGFQVMTIAPDGFSPGGMDPFRLFVASSTPLIQDIDPNYSPRLRLLHYVIADRASFLVSEMFYPVETDYQLAELIALPESGRFLSLEVNSHGGKIYQVATGDATDTSRVEHLRGNLRQIKPLQKQLLFDLENLDIPTTQLTGMTLGPKLSNGRQSLVLVGQNSEQMAELLWFGVS